MRFSKSWTIASKDFNVFLKKKRIIYSIFAMPLIVSIALPLILEYAGHKNGASGIPASELTILMPALLFFYLIIGTYIPAPIASYTMVGEKVEKSLEPLLATPITDGEILFGKSIAAFVPAVGGVYGGAAVFMVLSDLFTRKTLGYYYFPNWGAAVLLLIMVPLAVLMSVEANVIVSSRTTDVRTAQQIGSLMVMPFAGVYVSGELGIISLGTISTLLTITGILLLVDIVLLYLTRATFRRDEILTKWK